MEQTCMEEELSCSKTSHAGEVDQDRDHVLDLDAAPSREVEASHVHARDHLALSRGPSLEIAPSLLLLETTIKT